MSMLLMTDLTFFSRKVSQQDVLVDQQAIVVAYHLVRNL